MLDAVREQQLEAIVLARDTIAQGCWCVRVGGCTRLTQTWWRR